MISLGTAYVRQFGQEISDLIFPRARLTGKMPRRIDSPFCEQCGEPSAGVFTEEFYCTNCRNRPWTLAWARAAYVADGPVREVIHAFKYQQHFYWLETLADWLETGYRLFAAHENWDALVSVPLFHVRQRERGFNQSHELATVLGRRQRIPVWPCLKRVLPTSQQAKLSRAGRLRNLKGAFELKRKFDVAGKNLLLIDDVFTTGATAEACARILVTHHARRVAVLTVARA